jgi:hypothetical protein
MTEKLANALIYLIKVKQIYILKSIWEYQEILDTKGERREEGCQSIKRRESSREEDNPPTPN